MPVAANSSLATNAVVNSGNADAAFNAFNNAFLVNAGGKRYYKKSVNDGTADRTWVASLDIIVAEDAYARTGSTATKLWLILCNTWLRNTPPWDWDGWNDDIGWLTMALIRDYQMTGTANFLTQARYGIRHGLGPRLGYAVQRRRHLGTTARKDASRRGNQQRSTIQ